MDKDLVDIWIALTNAKAFLLVACTTLFLFWAFFFVIACALVQSRDSEDAVSLVRVVTAANVILCVCMCVWGVGG